MRPLAFLAFRNKLHNAKVTLICRCVSRITENGQFRKAGVDLGKRSDRWVLERYTRAKSRFNTNKQVLGAIQPTNNAAIVVLSTGAQGLGKSILLELDHDRYLFNAPDGLLRALYEANDGRGIPTTENIFFTSKTLETVGGLIGFMLSNTMHLDSDLTVKLHGPPFVHSILRILDYFSEKNEGRLSNIEWRGMPHEQYEDAQLTVEYIALYDRSSDSISENLNTRGISQSENSNFHSDKHLSMPKRHVSSDFDLNLKNSYNDLKTFTQIYEVKAPVSSSEKSIVTSKNVATQKSGGLNWNDIFIDPSECANEIPRNSNEYKTLNKDNGSNSKKPEIVGNNRLNIDDILSINELDCRDRNYKSDSHEDNAHKEILSTDMKTIDVDSLFENNVSSSVSNNSDDSSTHVSDDELESEENGTEDYILKLQKAKKMAMAYIVKLKHSHQKVDAQKVYELGEKSGPWVGDLVRGKSVTLSSGRVVTPEEVYSDSSVEVWPIVVLEVPTVGHLDDLLSSAKLRALQTSQGSKGPEVIVHMTPQSVMEDPRYREFMNRYSCQHLVLNENSGMVNLKGAHTVSAVNNQVHPELFPLARGFIEQERPSVGTDQSLTYGEYCLKYVLRPEQRRGLDRSSIATLDPHSCVRSELQSAESDIRRIEVGHKTRYTPLFAKGSFPQELNKFHDRLKSGKIDTPIFTTEYPKITFLGTGTAKPNLKRNSSGILLEIRKDEYMILDPGEGTYRQMLMMFGHAETLRILAHLKAVFVSHLHFDHHGGVFTLMKWRQEAVQMSGGGAKVFFLVPHMLQKWLKIFANQVIDISTDIIFLPQLIGGTFELWKHSNYEKMKKALHLKKYMSVAVHHTSNSSGLVLEHLDGWKLVYSGDTTPHNSFIKYGKDCDILIHEATNLPCEQDLARHNCHSTVAEAILVGKAMRAKYTLLTHFSAKMTHMPLLSDSFTRDIGYAFDMMQIQPNQLHLLYHMKPVFESLYGPSVALANLKTSERVGLHKLSVFSQGMEETLSNHEDFRYLEYLKQTSRDSDKWRSSNLKERLENLEEKQHGGG